jgi:hypothetical protein
VTSSLNQHGLLEALVQRERALVTSSYLEHRGAKGRVCWALGVTPGELSGLIAEVGLQDQVDEIRERFRREALGSGSLAHRLDLLGRGKYLADLGIQKKFTEALTRDLSSALKRNAEGASSPSEAVKAVARAQGAPAELVERAAQKLGLLK